MIDGEHRLDETADPRGYFQMADVSLERAQDAKLVPRGADAKRLGQRGHLDGIAQRRARAVGLDVADGFQIDARERLGRGNRLELALDARCHVADLARAVVVYREAANDGVNMIAVLHRLAGPFERNQSDAVAEDGAVRGGVEGTAAAILRDDAPLLVGVTAPLRKGDRDAARERKVALEGE